MTTLQPLERRILAKQRQIPEPAPVIRADEVESSSGIVVAGD